jgi:hypothetical protein
MFLGLLYYLFLKQPPEQVAGNQDTILCSGRFTEKQNSPVFVSAYGCF